MSILRKNFEPAFKGEVIPGTPAVPGHPAYCADEVIHHSSGQKLVILPDPGNPDSGRPPGYFFITVTTGPWDEVVHTCYDAVAGSPAGPPTKIPATLAKYFPGWNAAADSIASLTGSGQYKVSANPGATGIVTGFTPEPAGTGYSNISHGFYFSNGQFQIMEAGEPMTSLQAFSPSDEFIIARETSGRVQYRRGSTLLYASEVLSEGVVWVDASLYFGGDEITNAALEPLTGPPLDSSAPSTPPEGYGPGGGPIGVPPPGHTLLWNVCHGELGSLQGRASDTLRNDVDSGPPPPPGWPTDPTGDWPGRMGGTWRQFVGHAEGQGYGNWNGGTVGEPGSGTTPGHGTPGDGIPPGPGEGGPVDPASGDWDGRSGGQWTQFVGSGFGSTGDGTHYAIASGELPAFTCSAGAELLTPQYAICEGQLQPFAGWGTTLVGQTGEVRGQLGEFFGDSATVDGGFVDSDGPPPFGPPVSGGGGGTVGPLFHDTFSGSGTIEDHLPEVGVAYVEDGCHPLDELALNGTGGLPIGDGLANGYCIEQPLDLTGHTSLTTTQVVQIDTITPGVTLYVDSTLDLAATDDWIYETYLQVQIDGTIHLEGDVYAADGSTLYDSGSIDITADFDLGVPHTITMEVTPTGVVWKLDGIEVFNSGGVLSDVPLADLTGYETDLFSGGGGGTTGILDETTVVDPTATGSGPPTDAWTPDPETGDWVGRSGGQWPQFVVHAYTMDATASGGSFDETYGGHYHLLAQGYSPSVINDPVTGFPVGYGFYGLHGGEYLLDAWGGGLFSVTGPVGFVVAEGLAAIVGGFVATGPSGLLAISGVAGLAGGLDAHHFGKWTLTANGGGVFAVTGPAGTLGSSTGSGTAGGGAFALAIGGFAATGPHGQLTAAGYTLGLGTFNEVGPALEPVWGDLFSIGPHGQLVAVGNPLAGVPVLASDTEGYSVTLMDSADGLTTAVAHYTRYPFSQIVRFGSAYFGITPTGIYQLGGDTFDGAPIVAVVTHPPHDFLGRLGRSANEAQQKVKTMRSVLLTGLIPASLQVSVAVDASPGTTSSYSYTPQASARARNHRVVVGRGLEGRYIAMSLTNPDGRDFTLEEVSAEFDVSKQRDVWRT